MSTSSKKRRKRRKRDRITYDLGFGSRVDSYEPAVEDVKYEPGMIFRTGDGKEYRVMAVTTGRTPTGRLTISGAGISMLAQELAIVKAREPDWKPKKVGGSHAHHERLRKLSKHKFRTLEWDDEADQLFDMGLRVAMMKGHPGMIHEDDWHFVETLREIRGENDQRVTSWVDYKTGVIRMEECTFEDVDLGGSILKRPTPKPLPTFSPTGRGIRGASCSLIVEDELAEYNSE